MKQAFITIFAAALLVVGCHPENTPVSGITLTPPYVEITCGDTVHLKATATPEDASYTLEWSSSDNSVATVDEYGVITAVAAGKTVITAMQRDCLPQYCYRDHSQRQRDYHQKE